MNRFDEAAKGHKRGVIWGIMPIFSDVQETAAQYEKYIAEFQDLFRANDMSCGTPENFFRLAPRIAHDDSFRQAFGALTKSVQKREEGHLKLTEMLTVIGVAAAGREIERAGDAGVVPASLMTVFLAGIGGWSGTDSVAESAQPTDTSKAADTTDDEREAMELEQRLAAGPPEDLEALTTSLFGGPAQVKEALSRLEMNTLQLKMHLDSIDSRMERIEPHLDDLKSRIPAPEALQTDAHAGEELEPVPVPPIKPWPSETEELPSPEWAASAPPMKPWPAEKERDLVWEPRPDPNAAPSRVRWPEKQVEPEWHEPLRERVQEPSSGYGRALAHGAARLRMEEPAGNLPEEDLEDDLNIRVPFGEYLGTEQDARGGRKVAAVLLVLLIVLGGCFGWLLYRNHGWHGVKDAERSAGAIFAQAKETTVGWVSARAAGPASSVTANKAPTETTIAPQTPRLPASSPSPAPATAQAAPEPAAAAPPPPASSAKTQDKQAGEAAEQAPAKPSTSRITSRIRPVVTVIAGSGMAPETSSQPVTVQGVASTVPIFVDAAHLTPLSEPQPSYPRDALAREITGEVVVQAIVSASGDVESAQIVSGPAGLLKSSVDAVRGWRFRPYRLNGAPTEIRTYIRFQYGVER